MENVKKRGFFAKKDVDMTEGNIVNHIIMFAFPLLIGNLFQQFYNTVDTWVVGNYVENDAAFAAVGSVGPIINMIIGLFVGFSSGAGVIISQYYGARNEKKMQDAVHTAIALCFIGGVILIFVGIAFSPISFADQIASPGLSVFKTFFSCRGFVKNSTSLVSSGCA